MSEISCKYCGRDGMDKHQNLVHVCDRATVEQRYDEADARIAELEAALAAAQERERAATLRGNWYEQWIEDTTLEDYREQGEFEDDAKRMTERNMQSRRERMAEYVAAALAAAQPASDGGEGAA